MSRRERRLLVEGLRAATRLHDRVHTDLTGKVF
jgi:hypothetical protein